MFSFKAVVRDAVDGTEYLLEHPLNGEWHLYRNGQELRLTDNPQMKRDGGTVEVAFTGQDISSEVSQPTTTTSESSDDKEWGVSATFVLSHKLIIPQQTFTLSGPATPILNGQRLELVEWWIGGKQYLNGTVVQD